MHKGDLEHAHDILLSKPNVKSDPWLLSAEIAVASARKRTSKCMKSAQGLLTSASLSGFSKSELFSAVASVELDEGSTKRARKLFEQSLLDPTENAVAQAVYVARVRKVPLAIAASILTSYEGIAQDARSRGEWSTAIDATEAWLADQPFSSRPAMLGSYLTAIPLGDYRASVQFCRCGLKANPDDFLLRNNLAFALLQSGDALGGAAVFDAIDETSLSDTQMVVWLATRGLVAYRMGKRDEGFSFYDRSVELAKRLKLIQSKALAQIFFAGEELRAGGALADRLKVEAAEAVKSCPDHPDIATLARRLDLTDDSASAPTGREQAKNDGPILPASALEKNGNKAG